jgi:hypothetical protein
VDYYNSGCWVNTVPTYLTVDEAGVQICRYEGIPYDYAPGEESTAEPQTELFPGGELPAMASIPALSNYESLRC